MPLKKRAAAAAKSSTANKGKRQKPSVVNPVTCNCYGLYYVRLTTLQKPSEPTIDNEQAAVDITALNATQSPLLRLPAELRNAIWNPAFGDKIIEVYTEVHFDPDDPDAHFDLHYIAFERGAQYPKNDREQISPPQLVCKQYWSEVFQVFLSSCIFNFLRPDDLDFVISGHNTVALVRRVKVTATLDTSRSRCLCPTRRFSTPATRELRSLEGVDLEISYWEEVSEDVISNVMSKPVWNKAKLPVVVRGFQQHKLKESITTVYITDKKRYHRVKEGPLADAAAEI